MNTFRIFVINLERDSLRREAITAQLNALGIEFEFFPGVYWAGLPPEKRMGHYSDLVAKLNLGTSMVPAQIGCALSHVGIYKEIIAQGVSHALILEDDVLLKADIKNFITFARSYLPPNRPDVVLLSPAEAKAGSPVVPVFGDYGLYEYGSGLQTSSYFVTNAAARTLYAELYPVSDTADCWPRLVACRVINLFIMTPALIEQDQVTFGSSTTEDYWRHKKHGVVASFKYKLWRLSGKVLWRLYAPYRRFFYPYRGLYKDRK